MCTNASEGLREDTKRCESLRNIMERDDTINNDLDIDEYKSLISARDPARFRDVHYSKKHSRK